VWWKSDGSCISCGVTSPLSWRSKQALLFH
jgi:hypothetical protein